MSLYYFHRPPRFVESSVQQGGKGKQKSMKRNAPSLVHYTHTLDSQDFLHGQLLSLHS